MQFQSHYGAIATCFSINAITACASFNPTMVRLLQFGVEEPCAFPARFNPTMVRLLR